MALYRVQGNGKAPAGLQAGDEVVTGGGTYRILGVNADGSYRSVATMVDWTEPETADRGEA
mgnify:CR=1 FL=1